MNENWCAEALQKKSITAAEARDVLVACFIEAHREAVEEATFDLELPEDKKEEIILGMVKKAFNDTKGNFDKPTKKSLLAAMNQLKEIAKYFRNPEIVKRHYFLMRQIIDKVE